MAKTEGNIHYGQATRMICLDVSFHPAICLTKVDGGL